MTDFDLVKNVKDHGSLILAFVSVGGVIFEEEAFKPDELALIKD